MARLAPNFRRGFYDGSEIHWCQNFGHGSIGSEGFMMAVKSNVSNFWPWLDWHQIFGEGFMMAVKSIGVKILAMDRLAARVL